MTPEYYETYKADPDFRARRAAASRKWYAENQAGKPRAAEQVTKRRAYGKIYSSARKIEERGLTLVQFCFLLYYQNECCAICRTPFDEFEHRTNPRALDHDHATGKIRGVLCRGCNLILGHAKDNPTVLLRAAEYLENHAWRTTHE